MTRKCWANSLGGCTKISGEHVFSKGLFGVEAVTVIGLKAIPDGTSIPVTRITANILCVSHNSKLSPVDAEMKKVVDAVRARAQGRALAADRIVVDGWKIERWCLKTACNMLASGWFGKDVYVTPPYQYVNAAFGNARLWEDSGLYVVKKPQREYSDHEWSGTMIAHGNDVINYETAFFSLCGFGLLVSTGRGDVTPRLRGISSSRNWPSTVPYLDWSDAELLHRPVSVDVEIKTGRSAVPELLTIDFDWSAAPAIEVPPLPLALRSWVLPPETQLRAKQKIRSESNAISKLVNMATFGTTDNSEGNLVKRRLISCLATMIDASDLPAGARSEALILLTALGMKVTSIFQHAAQYKMIEEARITQVQANPIDLEAIGKADSPKGLFIVVLNELYREFDAFLVQLMSALDHVHVFLKFGFGLSFRPSKSNYGNRIRRRLLKRLPGSEPRVNNCIRAIIDLVEQAQPWLDDVIDLHDRIQQFSERSLRPETFAVIAGKTSDKVELHRSTLPDGRLVLAVIDELKQKTFDFIEVFAGVAICAKITNVDVEYRVHADSVSQERWVFRMHGAALWSTTTPITPAQ